MHLVNRRADTTVASDVEVAVTRSERRRGLLGRDHFAPSAALMLAPCWAVHTFFMRFPIDVVFVDRRGRVVRVVEGLRPWRMAADPRAHAVVELPIGRAEAGDVRAGDELALLPPPRNATAIAGPSPAG